jgi:hypothetical protein
VQQLPALQADLCLNVSRLVSTTSGPSAEGSSGAPDQQQQHLQQQQRDQVLPAAQGDNPMLFSDDTFASTSEPVLQPAQQPNIAAVGPRKVDPSRFGGTKGPGPKREGVVHVNSTFNNTHLVLTDRSSKVETWVSGGTVGYKNANKVRALAVLLGVSGRSTAHGSNKARAGSKLGSVCLGTSSLRMGGFYHIKQMVCWSDFPVQQSPPRRLHLLCLLLHDACALTDPL